jgi:hypothetical protein
MLTPPRPFKTGDNELLMLKRLAMATGSYRECTSITPTYYCRNVNNEVWNYAQNKDGNLQITDHYV